MLVLALWLGLSFLPSPAYETVSVETPGQHDLRQSDFENTVYRLDQAWDSWPDQLLSPTELATTEQPPVEYDTFDSPLRVGTFRLMLSLPPGETYGITARSSDYAMRLYLNGEEVERVGVPAATAEESEPAVREMTYYFTPTQETTELVAQFSNHVHAGDGTKAPKLTVGSAASISSFVQAKSLRTGILFGCLIVAYLYYFAAFLLNRKHRASLLFSLMCLIMAFLTVEGFATLSSDYSWLLLYRLSYACSLLLSGLFVLLVKALFPGVLHRAVIWFYLAFCGVYLLLSLMTPTLFFTRILVIYQAVSIGVILYGLVRLILTLRQKRLKNMLAVLGLALFCLFILYDILHQNGISPSWYIHNQKVIDSSSGLVLLIACYALVLAIDQRETNVRLENAHKELKAAKARYVTLLKENETSKPGYTLRELNLTKRETEIAVLLLDGKTREEIADLLQITKATVNFHCGNVYRKANVENRFDFMHQMTPNSSPLD